MYRWEDTSLNQNWNYLYFQVSSLSHSICCIRSRPGDRRNFESQQELKKMTKELQERTQLIEWDDGDT